VKIIVHGPVAGAIWDGTIESFMPDQPLEIDDGNKDAVAWARGFVSAGLATLVEDVKAKETVEDVKAKETRAPARQSGGRA
jgi:hypothetical protein